MQPRLADRKFLLLFYHSPAGIRVDDIGALRVDEVTRRSLVVAARGGQKLDGRTFFRHRSRAPGRPAPRRLSVGLQPDHGRNYGVEATESHESSPEASPASVDLANVTLTDTLLVLAHDDGQPISSHPGTHVVAARRGGSPLVAEFLLSNFASRHGGPSREWCRADGAPMTFDETFTPGFAAALADPDGIEQNLYTQRWIYDFSLADDFSQLRDTYEKVWFNWHDCHSEECERVVFGIDQAALTEMHGCIRAPRRRHRPPCGERDHAERRDRIRQVIMERLDYIGTALFRQPPVDTDADRRRFALAD